MEVFDRQAIDACVRGFEQTFRDESYYSSGRSWADYAPAYRLALRGFHAHGGERFRAVEAELADEWENVRGGSRLTWAEARPAMEAAWRLARMRSGS